MGRGAPAQAACRRCERRLICYARPHGSEKPHHRRPRPTVGHADDAALASGVTAIMFDQPAVAAVDVRGGAPGTRETDLLDAHRTVEKIDAVVLSGGSAFGLDSPSGVQACLREHGRGFAIGDVTIPIVPRRGAVRHDQRRRQEMGTLPALSRSRLRGGGRRRRRLRARHRGRGLRRHHGRSQGRARLGLGGDARAATRSARSSR